VKLPRGVLQLNRERILVHARPIDGVPVLGNHIDEQELREAAANLFRAMRALDDDPRVAEIYALPLPNYGLGLAINERLERAAS